MATRDDVYYKFGITAEAAQLFETSLGTLLLCAEGLKRGWHLAPDPKESRVFLDGIEKDTVRTLLRRLQSFVGFDNGLLAVMESAVDTRNRLFHGFYERHNFKILADDGRDAMIADLEAMHTELFNAWQMADAMSALAMEHIL